MPGNKEHRLQCRREKVSELYNTGYSQREIATQLNVSQYAIYNDIKVLHEQWQKTSITNYNGKVIQECKKLNAIEAEAWAAWRRSQLEEVTRERQFDGRKSIVSGKSKVKYTVKRKKNVGDAKYLDVVHKCIESRCKLFGLNAPQEIDLYHEIDSVNRSTVTIELDEDITEILRQRACNEDCQSGFMGEGSKQWCMEDGQAPGLS